MIFDQPLERAEEVEMLCEWRAEIHHADLLNAVLDGRAHMIRKRKAIDLGDEFRASEIERFAEAEHARIENELADWRRAVIFGAITSTWNAVIAAAKDFTYADPNEIAVLDEAALA
jgi:hypothetical protein